jgi:hypothetical protein
MGRMSRAKGCRGEREVVALAKEAGFIRAERAAPLQAAKGDEHHADVEGVGRLFVEVKRHAKVSVPGCMKALLAKERPGFIRVLVHRDNGGKWLATLEATELLKLERDALRCPADRRSGAGEGADRGPGPIVALRAANAFDGQDGIG